jgi:hypothetical protein
MLGTGNGGTTAGGELERPDRLGVKNEVNLDDVLEKDVDRP